MLPTGSPVWEPGSHVPHDMAKKTQKTKDAKKKETKKVLELSAPAVGPSSSHPLYLTWLNSQVSASFTVLTSLSEAF